MVRDDRAATTGKAVAPSRLALLLAFFAIYVIWGSTYLAIRYAVETIPPLIVVGVRHCTAGLILFAWARARGYRPTPREWGASLVLGILYFAIGHGLLHWAETIVPSGLTALLMSAEPIWIALMAMLVTREERLTGRTAAGLLLGIAGVALLMRGASVGSHHAGLLLGSVAVLVSGLSWSVGVIYSRRDSLPRDSVARAGMASLCGSAFLLIASLLSGEVARAHWSNFSARSLWSVAYLIVFGSVVAFTSYTWLLEHCSPTLVSTHTYANPIVAVFLGWMLAGEIITLRVIAAGAVTLLAVFLISRGTSGELAREISEAEAA